VVDVTPAVPKVLGARVLALPDVYLPSGPVDASEPAVAGVAIPGRDDAECPLTFTNELDEAVRLVLKTTAPLQLDWRGTLAARSTDGTAGAIN